MFPDLGLMMSSLAGGGVSKGKTIGHYYGEKAEIYGVMLEFETFRKVT